MSHIIESVDGKKWDNKEAYTEMYSRYSDGETIESIGLYFQLLNHRISQIVSTYRAIEDNNINNCLSGNINKRIKEIVAEYSKLHSNISVDELEEAVIIVVNRLIRI